MTLITFLIYVAYLAMTTDGASWLSRRFIRPEPSGSWRFAQATALWVLYSVSIVLIAAVALYLTGTLLLGAAGYTFVGVLFYSATGSLLNILVAGGLIYAYAMGRSMR
jgi:hypothetical protein